MSTRILPDYSGRYVRLTEERVEHIRLHPELRTLHTKIEEVLISPALVVRSRTDSQTRLYYREYETELFGRKWLCVVVKSTGIDDFVLTSYLTDAIKRGDVIWQAK